MRSTVIPILLVVVGAVGICAARWRELPSVVARESVDGRVVQVRFPVEDVVFSYVEARTLFTVQMESKSASIEAPRMYIGDGEVAILLEARGDQGLYLQGESISQGNGLKAGSAVKLRPGFKKAADLAPGTIYVTLPAVQFDVPVN